MPTAEKIARTAKVLTVGSSAGIVLTKEMLAHLNVQKGDTLYILKTPDGIKLTPYDAGFAHKVEILEQIMRENRDVLKKLAE
jgi:putative addiction module antidote